MKAVLGGGGGGGAGAVPTGAPGPDPLNRTRIWKLAGVCLMDVRRVCVPVPVLYERCGLARACLAGGASKQHPEMSFRSFIRMDSSVNRSG